MEGNLEKCRKTRGIPSNTKQFSDDAGHSNENNREQVVLQAVALALFVAAASPSVLAVAEAEVVGVLSTGSFPQK